VKKDVRSRRFDLDACEAQSRQIINSDWASRGARIDLERIDLRGLCSYGEERWR
jgi:hypothetical protein